MKRALGGGLRACLPILLYHGIGEHLEGHKYLTWAEVQDLHSPGISIGAHTVTHPELRHRREPKIDREMGESKRTIEVKLAAATVEG